MASKKNDLRAGDIVFVKPGFGGEDMLDPEYQVEKGVIIEFGPEVWVVSLFHKNIKFIQGEPSAPIVRFDPEFHFANLSDALESVADEEMRRATKYTAIASRIREMRNNAKLSEASGKTREMGRQSRFPKKHTRATTRKKSRSIPKRR